MSTFKSNRAAKPSPRSQITPEEYQLIQDLRVRNPAQNPPKLSPTLGERVADRVAATMGSWTFIIIQSILLIPICVQKRNFDKVLDWNVRRFFLLFHDELESNLS